MIFSRLFLATVVIVVQVLAVLLGDDLEAVGRHVVHTHDASTGRVPVGGSVDGPPPQLVSFLVSQVVSKQKC